jgi:Flp pilus assembly pilin Flp
MDVFCERGQTMSEYALVLGLITLATVLVVAGLSSSIVSMFTAAVGAFG